MSPLSSISQTSTQLGIPVATLYDLVRRKAIPFHRFGDRIFLDPEEVRAATHFEPESRETTEKNPAAVTLGRLGGFAAAGAGMRKRLEKMTPAQRKALAKKAARARWKKK